MDEAATEQDIAACFRLLLGRGPSAAEWEGHRALAGQPLGAVVKNYLDSAEFAARWPAGAARVVRCELNGVVLHASLDDLAVGRHVAGGAYEPEVAAVFRRYLRPGMAVVDVGANIGVFTMLAASLVGAGGRVLAVEPNGENVRLLEASRRANGFGQVAVAFCAAGPGPAVVGLETAYSNGVTSAVAGGALMGARLAPCLPLGMLAAGRVDFIKIDVEGAEHLILADAAEMLRRERPVIVSEFSPSLLWANSGVTPEAYLALLAGLGYSVAVIGEGGAAAPCEDAAAVMARWRASGGDHVDLVCMA